MVEWPRGIRANSLRRSWCLRFLIAQTFGVIVVSLRPWVPAEAGAVAPPAEQVENWKVPLYSPIVDLTINVGHDFDRNLRASFEIVP